MKTITIDIDNPNNFEVLLIKESLITLAKNITPANLVILADLSNKPDINIKFPKLLNNPLVKMAL